ncbi:DUF3472 domain-containing protein [Ectopseudomonas mendocina]|uniref:DUF3472 domain-containing protein n=1 Tax=Ectopseudomonas mendocina TaxID=300 RepID=A0ABZ2RKC8_ECTME
MKFAIAKKLLLPALLIVSPLSHAVVAGGIVSIRNVWPAGASYNQMAFYQQISNDGGPKSHYFWANQFHFKGGDGGYIGLQNRGNGVHAFNYSIWKAKGWKSGNCKHFSHEGSGVQCQVEYPWKTGHIYQLKVLKEGNLVKGVIYDFMTGQAKTVGVIEVTETFGGLYASSGFVEEYSQGNGQLSSCSVIGAQSSVFYNPVANDSVRAEQSTKTYGNCNDGYIVQAACNASACINVINDLGAIPSPSVKQVPVVHSNDLGAQTIANALSDTQQVTIQTTKSNWAPNIFFPSPGQYKWKSIFVDHRASNTSSLHINGSLLTLSKGQQLSYVSDGKSWNAVTVQ